jgi:G2/mitotic-specific cyclin 1/2
MFSMQDETLEYYAGYSEEEIQPVVALMVDYMARPVIHEAFFKKYASKKFLKGMLCFHLPHVAIIGDNTLTRNAASILTRQWSKRNAAAYGIDDIHLTLDEVS